MVLEKKNTDPARLQKRIWAAWVVFVFWLARLVSRVGVSLHAGHCLRFWHNYTMDRKLDAWLDGA